MFINLTITITISSSIINDIGQHDNKNV